MITVSYFGNLMRFRNDPSILKDDVIIKEGSTLKDFCTKNNIPIKEISVFSCNGKQVSINYIPRENDHIGFFGFVSGG